MKIKSATPLVVVESPTKAKTIGKLLGDTYTILSSYGHVRDLPKTKLGIDTEHDFEPQYVTPPKARPVLKALKDAMKKHPDVILATDEDREGEAISWHLINALGLDEHKAKRIVFHEITKSAILSALEHPRALDMNMVNAQQARRVLDRLVGYKLSPFLWKKVAKGLSAGRVQSVTLRLIVEREQEIRKFKPEEYWTIGAKFDVRDATFEAILSHVNGKTIEKFDLKTAGDTTTLVEILRSASYTIASVEETRVFKNPPAPFTTSTLQQESAKRLRYSSSKTMLLAQRLYEVGLITYMRTDSTNLSAEALGVAKSYITKTFGTQYATEAPRTFQTKSRVAQEAHEAIRPTDVTVSPTIATIDGAAEQKLYALIWNRFVASQLPRASFDHTTIAITTTANGTAYQFTASGNILRFDGFLKVWEQKFEEKTLPVLKQGDTPTVNKILPEQHFTEPPARYSEASLIKTLEKFGIGRPSTYAPTIRTIQARNYVKKEQGRFLPTELGELVHGVLIEHFNEIVDVGFTAAMEESLDAVANGEGRWQDLIKNFYDPFIMKLEEKYKDVAKVSPDEKTDIVCDLCGKPMIIKFGRFGKFIACSGFPACKNTKKLAGQGPKLIGMKCPDCKEGDVVERRVTRGRARGKVFWGCSKYPTCKYASWEDPLNPKKESKTSAPAATEAPEPKEMDID